MKQALQVLPGAFAICRLDPNAAIPEWATGDWVSLTRTTEELSVVCEEDRVPSDVKHDRGWRCLRLVGSFDLNLTGVLASVLQPLADASVGVFALSTFDTDYVLVRTAQLDKALAALREAGHSVGGGEIDRASR